MTDLLIYTLPGIAIGFVIGWVVRDYVRQAQQDLVASDRDLDRVPHIRHDGPPWCPRCGRMDGSHTTACERSRLDVFVAPVSPARRRTERQQ